MSRLSCPQARRKRLTVVKRAFYTSYKYTSYIRTFPYIQRQSKYVIYSMCANVYSKASANCCRLLLKNMWAPELFCCWRARSYQHSPKCKSCWRARSRPVWWGKHFQWRFCSLWILQTMCSPDISLGRNLTMHWAFHDQAWIIKSTSVMHMHYPIVTTRWTQQLARG